MPKTFVGADSSRTTDREMREQRAEARSRGISRQRPTQEKSDRTRRPEPLAAPDAELNAELNAELIGVAADARITRRAADATTSLPFSRTLVDRIRREFFARAAAAAQRYGVRVEEILEHLARANLAGTPGPARVLACIEDLVLVCACVRSHPQAWHDAWSRHEGMLIRACRLRLEDSDAVVFARRFWIDLYSSTTGTCGTLSPGRVGSRCEHAPLVPSLAEYVGVRPLRVWLADRLIGRLEAELRREDSERSALRWIGTANAMRTSPRLAAAIGRPPRDDAAHDPLLSGAECPLRLVD